MKICLIGSFLPRKCGIATFSHNLLNSTSTTNLNGEKLDAFIVAVNDCDNNYDYPPEVEFSINQNVQDDYLKAAEYINAHADICILQHEYGIYGGQHGVYILTLLNKLEVPVIATLHTIFKKPNFFQKIIFQQICNKASQVVVMSRLAVKFLKHIYHIADEKIALIEHGVPYLDNVTPLQKELGPFADKRILFTFGLLSRNKGIETVIEALPRVVKNHPDVV